MKKLILTLAIMFCAVGVIRFVQLVRAERMDAVLNHVISCDEFYEKALQFEGKALQNSDDTTIVNVFKAIKNNPDAYICVQLPYGYMAWAKEYYKGIGAKVTIITENKGGLTKVIDGMAYMGGNPFWFGISTNGSIKKEHITRSFYFDFWRMDRATLKSRLVYGSLAK